MTKEIQGVVLTVLGIVVLRLAVGTAYLNYVKESLRPWLLVSGAVLVVLGVLTFVDVVLRRSVPDEEPESDDGHGHGHRGPRVAWLIFLPVVAVFVVAPPALGAFSAARSPAVPSLLDTSLPDLPAGDPVTLYLSDYVQRAVWDKGTTLTGRTVELTGFVLPQPGGGWQLARMQITCCAADAFASKVQPVGPMTKLRLLPRALPRPGRRGGGDDPRALGARWQRRPGRRDPAGPGREPAAGRTAGEPVRLIDVRRVDVRRVGSTRSPLRTRRTGRTARCCG
ncbi:MAG: TIGR03943 family protein [Candidatus Nanopelagicales bacterium]